MYSLTCYHVSINIQRFTVCFVTSPANVTNIKPSFLCKPLNFSCNFLMRCLSAKENIIYSYIMFYGTAFNITRRTHINVFSSRFLILKLIINIKQKINNFLCCVISAIVTN